MRWAFSVLISIERGIVHGNFRDERFACAKGTISLPRAQWLLVTIEDSNKPGKLLSLNRSEGIRGRVYL